MEPHYQTLVFARNYWVFIARTRHGYSQGSIERLPLASLPISSIIRWTFYKWDLTIRDWIVFWHHLLQFYSNGAGIAGCEGCGMWFSLEINSKFVLWAWKVGDSSWALSDRVFPNVMQSKIENLFPLIAIHEVCVVISRYIKRMCGCDVCNVTVDGVFGNGSSGYNDCGRSIE